MMRGWLVGAFASMLALGACAVPEAGFTDTKEPEAKPVPVMVVDPLLIDFGAMEEGEEAIDAFWVSNEGTGPLEVLDVVLTGPASFTILSSPTLPLELDVGGQIKFDVAYSPEAVGEMGHVTVTGTDSLNPEQTVELLGTWSVPELQIDPDFVDFGELPPDCEELTTILLRSIGTGPLTVDSIALAGEGYTIVNAPDTPVVIDPGEAEAVEVSFLPTEDREYLGTLQVGSNDPAGPKMGQIQGRGQTGALCDGLMTYELEFDVDYKIADVAFLLDTTCSMGGTIGAMSSEFASIAGALAGQIPDITFGVATFDDYNYGGFGSGADKPFILKQQQTDDLGRVATVLGAIPLHSGADGPESSHEALFQAASGDGYDQDCDSNYDSGDDVKPFIASPLDAFGGLIVGEGDPDVPGTGEVGGMGFREKVFPIMILATDNELRDPEAGYGSPGGCSQDASFYHVYTSMAEIGAKFIGVAANMWGGVGKGQLINIAIVTDSYADMDGDLIEEPAVVEWSGSDAEFRELVVDAVLGLVASAWFDKISLEVVNDPMGLIVEIDPEAYFQIQAGTPVTFVLTVAGAIVEAPEAGAEEIELELVADDQIVLSRRTLFVIP
jgi:hypothetical protein